MCKWQGVFPAVTTQFQPDGSIDLGGTLSHIERLLAAGIEGLIMLGTVGENCSLLYEEKLELLRATVKHVGRRVPVLSGVAEYSTALGCRESDCSGSVLIASPISFIKLRTAAFCVHSSSFHSADCASGRNCEFCDWVFI